MLELLTFIGLLFVLIAPIIDDAHKAQNIKYELGDGWEWCDEVDEAIGLHRREIR